MNDLKSKYIVLILLVLFAQSIFGQTYEYKDFGLEEGLSHPFVYTVSEDADGFIWVGTGEGLCKFNGFEFKKSEADDTLTNGFVNASFLDKEGILWFGHNSGQITYYDGTNFELLNTGDFLNSIVTDITQDKKGNVFVATQNNGIIKINKDKKVTYFTESFSGVLINSIEIVGENAFLIGTGNGLTLYNLNADEFVKNYIIKELDYIAVQSIDKSQSENVYWLGTEDSGFFLLKLKGDDYISYEIINMGEKYELGYKNVQSILEDNQKILWLSTYSGIFKFIPDENEAFTYSDLINYNTSNGLSNNYIKTIYQDWEGNNWIGTFGSGLAFSVDEAFTFRYKDIKELKGDILSIAESESTIWLGGKDVIAKIDKASNNVVILDANNGIPKDNIVALYLDINQKLWIGSETKGIYQLNTKSDRAKVYFKSNNSLGNKINSIAGNGDNVWAGTENGVLVFDLKTGASDLRNTDDGLPYNNINQVFIDSENNPWIATKSSGVFVLDNHDLNYAIAGNINIEFTSVTEDVNGDIWASTYGEGVFKFTEDTIINYSTGKGLKSSYCYSIIADDVGKVWVGHRLGMSSIDANTGDIAVYGIEKGMTGDCNYNAVLKQENGVILTGTTDGLIVYDSSKEKKNIFAPRLNISEVLFSDKVVNFKQPIDLKYKIYKLNISFVGLSYGNPDGVTYQYMLEGYDLEWSKVTKNREAYYPRVEDGNYTFIIKACNFDGYCVEEPLKIKISIRPPIWKTWWFISLAIIIGLGAIFLYIKNRERKQKALQEYLEAELKIRTKEVTEQKDELEIKNRDITDSINYAQRIQQSILPSVNTMDENFSGAFVCYQPRDIVSGDFYWYEKINDDKFLIVCADSTGHGVPGAFMSMIGTTLIKDICWRKDVDSPSMVLEQLDKELQRTLNQNIDAERAHDGMDIIVCEIDVKTHYMRFSSAMRPLILYKDKELQYVKGTKASIGGDPKEEKRFENVGFQLHPGDIIYMFSDGYPDQFGGPRGKKFKMDRVKNMLAEVCDKPMEIQNEHVTKTFNDWRGKLQQVDDVLFMGVKI